MKMLSLVDAFPTGMTNRNAIKILMKKLYPMNTGKELIRLGPNSDGGYLVPNDLSDIVACFSPGVSHVSGFEKQCAELGMKVFLADNSVDQTAVTHDLFHFTKKHIGAISSDKFMTIDNWVTASLPESQGDLILQMDIEGSEYETLLGISEGLIRQFRIIVVEFHRLDLLWSRPFYRLASRVFEKILQTHTCVHIHPNNIKKPLNKDRLSIPIEAEFTFLRTDRVIDITYARNFPHHLDYDNTDKQHLTLPNCWYNNDVEYAE